MTTTLKSAAFGSSVALFGNTELASMANGQGTFGNGGGLTSQVWDNTSLRFPEAYVKANLGSLNVSAGGYLLLFLLWSLDGTDFPDPQYASGQSANNVGLSGTPTYTASLLSGTSAKIVTFPRLLLLPGKAKFILFNGSGVSLAATGNSVAMYPHTYEMQ